MKKQTHSWVRIVISLVLLLCIAAAGLTFWMQREHKKAVDFSHGIVSRVNTQVQTYEKKEFQKENSQKANVFAARNAALAKQISLKSSEIDHYLQRMGFSGTAVVVSHGHVLLNKGYGYSNLHFRILNRPATEYYIGSITKSVTATAFIRMEERGLISFDSRVSQFYPAFPHGRSISMLDLLCHVSGLRGIPETTQFVTRDEQIQRIADGNLRLSYKPGTRWAYEDGNYTLVAAILDKISLNVYGETLHQYIQQNIFNKAGMQQAGFGKSMFQSPYRSVGYGYFNELRQTPSFSQLFGCGDVYMSAWNLYLFDRALADQTLVSAAGYHNIFTSHFSWNHYSLGWYANRSGWGFQTYSSHGAVGGWNGSNAMSMDRQNYAVLLSNSSRTSGFIGAANQMIFTVLAKP